MGWFRIQGSMWKAAHCTCHFAGLICWKAKAKKEKKEKSLCDAMMQQLFYLTGRLNEAL